MWGNILTEVSFQTNFNINFTNTKSDVKNNIQSKIDLRQGRSLKKSKDDFEFKYEDNIQIERNKYLANNYFKKYDKSVKNIQKQNVNE